MSSPAEYYNSLPPITKAYGTACLLVTAACHLGLLDPDLISYYPDLTFSGFEVWRLITNFFFLGYFSLSYGFYIWMIATYGVQLENGPFRRRTADFLWMMVCGAFTSLVLSGIPYFSGPYLGTSLVFMLVYVWSREFPNETVSIYGLVHLKAIYLPWSMLFLSIINGNAMMPDLLGFLIGHVYHFFTVIHPRAGGIRILETPVFIHNFVAWWRDVARRNF